MKLSTRGKYGLYAMVYLAQKAEEGPQPLRAIAQLGLPDHYLEQLLGSLRKAGLVTTVRGAQGGYMLAKEPQEYTVGEILRLLEGNLAPVACVDDTKEACTRADECVTMEVWREIKDAVNKVVDNITLADLVEQQRQKCRCCK